MLVLKLLYHGYRWIFYDLADLRSDRYFLIRSPWYSIAISMLYLRLVNKILPNYMKNREPYNLKNVIIVFNLMQVLANGYFAVIGFSIIRSFDIRCTPVDFSETENGLFHLHLTYLYYLLKITDLLDTIFFILRKKNSHVSFLHVYHHFGMVLLGYVGVRFQGGGHSFYLGYLNTHVHVLMYSYYFFMALGGKYQKFAQPFKKRITQLQLAQFASFLPIYSMPFSNPDCAFPRIISFFLLCQALFFLFLFGDFYYNAYIKKGRTKSLKAEKQES